MDVRATPVVFAAVAALLAGACGAGDDEPAAQGEPVAQPAETVTVTETVTAPAEETEPAGDAARDPCATAGLEEVAFVFVTSPLPGDEAGDTVAVEGCANTFEANVQWRLLDRDGGELAAGHTTASCGSGCVGDLSFEVEVPAHDGRLVVLEVFESSAEDGSAQFVNSIPLLTSP